MDNIYEMKKSEYFKNNESIFIHLSDNVDFNACVHRHNFIELSYVVSGTAIHTIGKESYAVHKGNVILVDYQVPHCFTFDPLQENFVTYDLLFIPDFFNISMGNNEFYSLASSYLFSSIFSEFSSHHSMKTIVITKSREFQTLFKKIDQEYTNREKGFQNIIRAHLIELITKFFREISKQQPAFTQTHQDLVEKSILYMQENYKSHISLDDIVSGMFMSKNYFRQIFKKTTGMSISYYIQELRINKACSLLETTTDSISEIALQCGFNDMKFFYQTFKKAVGMTPMEYRKNKLIESVKTNE